MIHSKDDVVISYDEETIEDFKPINYELWAVIDSIEGYYCCRVFGFGKIIESPYSGKEKNNTPERIIVWKPLVMEEGWLDTIPDNNDYELFWHFPSIEEIKKTFSSGSSPMLRNKENYYWFDKSKEKEEMIGVEQNGTKGNT